jgi:hypothetical protein
VGLVTVSVLLATMGRPEKAQACVQSIKDTAEDVEIVVALDGPGAEALRDMGCVVDHATNRADHREHGTTRSPSPPATLWFSPPTTLSSGRMARRGPGDARGVP